MIMYHLIFIWHFSSQKSKGSLLTCSMVCMLKEVTFKFTVPVNLLHRYELYGLPLKYSDAKFIFCVLF